MTERKKRQLSRSKPRDWRLFWGSRNQCMGVYAGDTGPVFKFAPIDVLPLTDLDGVSPRKGGVPIQTHLLHFERAHVR